MTEQMHAVAYRTNLPITDPASLEDVELPVPILRPHDLLVRVEAVSVNPVDVKQRAGSDPGGEWRVLGYDQAGTVEAIGDAVTLFAVGDRVYSAGSIDRQGTDADLHAVDERIVGHMPTTLGFAEAAALPLTSITAWEALFDRFRLTADSDGTLLVLGGAGGVGSAMIQLARELTNVTIIATASRPESAAWVRELGAHRVVDHHGDLVAQLAEIAPKGVRYVFTPFSAGMIDTFAAIVAPGGEITAIDEPDGLDIRPLKSKSITWHWELMFTRALYGTDDLIEQHRLLDRVAELVDAGRFRTTLSTTLHGLDAATLREAHRLVESGRTVGKVVVTRE